MTLRMRTYQTEDDYWRLRAFLREVYSLSQNRELCWQAARLDYWICFGNPDLEHYTLSDVIHLWETEDGRIVSFITPESHTQVYPQVHPAFQTVELEIEMIAAAEKYLAEPDENGQRQLTIWAQQADVHRIRALQARGYTRGDWPEHQFRGCLDGDIAEVHPAPGYTIRSLGDESEVPDRCWVSWRAFHPDEPDSSYLGWKWYADIQRCPLYRRDLDLVVVAPDNSLAAFCTIWYDDVTRTGYFEPVGTSPDHQRKGLGKAIMIEGLHRLKRMGARYATVSGYSEAAIGLYSSVISPNPVLYERWCKSLTAPSNA